MRYAMLIGLMVALVWWASVPGWDAASEALDNHAHYLSRAGYRVQVVRNDAGYNQRNDCASSCVLHLLAAAQIDENDDLVGVLRHSYEPRIGRYKIVRFREGRLIADPDVIVKVDCVKGLASYANWSDAGENYSLGGRLPSPAEIDRKSGFSLSIAWMFYDEQKFK